MNDRDCVRFLQQTLPRLGLRWPGFRRVRGQVCKRLQRRLQQLQLPDLAAYRQYLERTPREWDSLDACCRITISRFCRDRGMFRILEREALPQLAADARARGVPRVRAWSAGCGGGEEPYSLTILWSLSSQPVFRDIGLDVLATDIDAGLLQRAQVACYPGSSTRELPRDWQDAAFSRRDELFCLRPEFRHDVRFLQHDLRSEPPLGRFDLVLCRNLAFTYFDAGMQRQTAQRLAGVLRDGGLLVLGAHEQLPEGVDGFAAWRERLPLYRRQR